MEGVFRRQETVEAVHDHAQTTRRSQGARRSCTQTELRKIVDEPKNGVEADIPLLFHGIHMDMKDDDGLMDMKDDDCLSRVCKFLADCAERIEARVMKGHLKKPEMRKKIFKRLLEVVDPEPVRDACVLDMEKAWHPSTYGAGRKKPGYEAKEVKNKIDHRKDDYSRQELRDVRLRRDDHERNRSQGRDRRDRSSNRANHETITQATPRYIATETVVVRTSDAMKTAVPVMDRPIANPSSKWDLRCDVDEAPLHPMEEFCTTAMGNETTEQKREAKKRKAKGLVETEDFIPLTNDSEDEVDEPDVIRRKGRTILNAKSAGANKTVRRVYGWDPSIRPGALAEDRAKIKYEWALVAKRMQNGTTLKSKAKKLRDSLMTSNKKWREEQEKSREAKAKEPEKKKLRRMLESSADESVATINGMLDVPYCPDNGSDVGIISTAMVKTLRKLDKTVQTTQLPKAWVGSAVGNLPVIAKTTLELR
ncbi:hypothetical protein DYB28_005969, partial [Aphanomyces astaci]